MKLAGDALQAQLEADRKDFAKKQKQAKLDNDKKILDQKSAQKVLDDENAKLATKQHQLRLQADQIDAEQTKLNKDIAKFRQEEKFLAGNPQHNLWLEKKQLEDKQKALDGKQEEFENKLRRCKRQNVELEEEIKSQRAMIEKLRAAILFLEDFITRNGLRLPY